MEQAKKVKDCYKDWFKVSKDSAAECKSHTDWQWQTYFPSQAACAALLEELKLSVQFDKDVSTEATAAENPGESTSNFVLVIEGSMLEFALQEELKSNFLELSCKCKAVICCRSTPLQKSQVVQLIRDQLGVMTLAVGKYLWGSTWFIT